jgi:hypothetical protein
VGQRRGSIGAEGGGARGKEEKRRSVWPRRLGYAEDKDGRCDTTGGDSGNGPAQTRHHRARLERDGRCRLQTALGTCGHLHEEEKLASRPVEARVGSGLNL